MFHLSFPGESTDKRLWFPGRANRPFHLMGVQGNFTVLDALKFFNRPIHCSRSSIMGSIDSARCAGIQVASSPSNDIPRTTPANTSGSRGVA
jgi:hypothetical protein